MLPALDRYDGPMFRVLRRFLRVNPNEGMLLDIFILSALYGLIPADYMVENYDSAMPVKPPDEMRDKVSRAFAHLIESGYSSVCLALGQRYSALLNGYLNIEGKTGIVEIRASQGKRLTLLKSWLSGGRGDTPKVKPKSKPQALGKACLRGTCIIKTSEEVIEHALTALQMDDKEASGFRDWYVEVKGRCVAPKWLVSSMTGIPVSAFTSSDARLVLARLGIESMRVGEIANDNQDT